MAEIRVADGTFQRIRRLVKILEIDRSIRCLRSTVNRNSFSEFFDQTMIRELAVVLLLQQIDYFWPFKEIYSVELKREIVRTNDNFAETWNIF